LTKRLDSLKTGFLKNPLEKLGIIIDQDSFTTEERLSFLNEFLQGNFNVQLSDNQIFANLEIDGIPLQIACYFVNVDGKRELESLLTKIKTIASPYADCLQQWQNCLTKKVSKKEFDKLWVHYYLKYDTATNDESKSGDKLFQRSFEKNPPIWNFDSPVLNELKGFLALFD
jgi:hypothetical protein